MSEAKKRIEQSFIVETFTTYSKEKLADFVDSLIEAQNRMGVGDDATVHLVVNMEPWDDDVDDIDIVVRYTREETDAEYNKRLQQERRQRATQANFAERKRARDIVKLQAEAKRLGFTLGSNHRPLKDDCDA